MVIDVFLSASEDYHRLSEHKKKGFLSSVEIYDQFESFP